MNPKLKIAIPIVAGIVAVGTLTGVVAAKAFARNDYRATAGYQDVSAQGGPGDTDGDSWFCGTGGYGGMMGYGAGATPQVASLLGTTVADLRDQLDSGKTLADIAAAKGVGQDQLVQTMMAPYQDHLGLAVKNGYLTQEQADSMAQRMREWLQRAATTNGAEYNGGGWGHMGGMMGGWGRQGDWQRQSGAAPTTGRGFGGMMGGNGGGMMGGYGGGFRGMMGGW